MRKIADKTSRVLLAFLSVMEVKLSLSKLNLVLPPFAAPRRGSVTSLENPLPLITFGKYHLVFPSYLSPVYASPDHTVAFLQGDVRAYEATYKELYKPLFIYSLGILNNQATAEEIVQNVFMKLWEKVRKDAEGEKLEIQSSLKAYLYKAVHNHSLNAIKHKKVVQQYETHLTHTMTHKESDSAERDAAHKQLQGRLRQALSELPEQCRTVFQMSRFEDLKYKEIAERLAISPKTVENHMGKALKLLRGKLADYLVSLLAFLIYISNNF